MLDAGMMDKPTLARYAVLEYYKEKLDYTLDFNATYCVWNCYILGNWKALVSTTRNDGNYFEVTFDSANRKIYVDCYCRQGQHVLQ